MEKDILIVPDVHGRDFWLPALDYPGEVIFLGDYTDPYPQENLTQEDAYRGLLKIVDFKRQNPERVTLLIGNHELHYYARSFGSSGRFSSEYYPKYNEILTGDSTKSFFKVCKQIDNYLFIHAGLTKGWYDLHYRDFAHLGSTLEEQLTNVFFAKMHIFHEASWKYRGGLDDAGSPFWADYRELEDEKEPFNPDIYQIIGHTLIMDPDPVIRSNFSMLDNRQLYVLRNRIIEKYI
ncbi:MAG: metallophosphoesterase [Tannerella sp.]|jgi:hypothetical protein|nr:metallophosphoesterase [Tannerella sp.]